MIIVRKSEERRPIAAENQTVWTTFDGENKTDQLRDGFSALKLFNQKVLSPGRGFILHTQKTMIVVTYVPEGVVVYNGPQDKTVLLEPGEFRHVKILSGGDPLTFHVPPDNETPVSQSGFAGGTGDVQEQKKIFTVTERRGTLRLIASADGKESSLKIHQDVQIYSALLGKGTHIIHELKPGRKAWLHVAIGKIRLNGLELKTEDVVGISDEIGVSFTAQEPAEILLFDLP